MSERTLPAAAGGGGVSHLCINSLIDRGPHCIQLVCRRDEAGRKRGCVSARVKWESKAQGYERRKDGA